MMENNTVLIIGGNKRVLTKAKEVGLYTINILEKCGTTKELEDIADETIVVEQYGDLDEIERIAKTLMERRPFHCAISLSEYGLLPAAHINDLFHLRGTSVETVKLLRHKGVMRKFLNDHNISTIKYQVGVDENDIKVFWNNMKGSFIVKPEDGAGSFQIHIVHTDEDIPKVWSCIQDAQVEKFIMEEYLDGPEVSVEAFSFDGEHKIINITDKLINKDFIEIGHSAPTNHSEKDFGNISSLVTEFLSAINLKDGPSHTEIKITSKGPRIVESHNRIGGDNITELVRIATEIDIIKYTFEWAFGLKGKIDKPIHYLCGAAIKFILPEEGKVVAIDGKDKIIGASCLEDFNLNLKVGDVVKQVNHSLDRSGYIIARGNNTNEALENCQKLLSFLKIETMK